MTTPQSVESDQIFKDALIVLEETRDQTIEGTKVNFRQFESINASPQSDNELIKNYLSLKNRVIKLLGKKLSELQIVTQCTSIKGKTRDEVIELKFKLRELKLQKQANFKLQHPIQHLCNRLFSASWKGFEHSDSLTKEIDTDLDGLNFLRQVRLYTDIQTAAKKSEALVLADRTHLHEQKLLELIDKENQLSFSQSIKIEVSYIQSFAQNIPLSPQQTRVLERVLIEITAAEQFTIKFAELTRANLEEGNELKKGLIQCLQEGLVKAPIGAALLIPGELFFEDYSKNGEMCFILQREDQKMCSLRWFFKNTEKYYQKIPIEILCQAQILDTIINFSLSSEEAPFSQNAYDSFALFLHNTFLKAKSELRENNNILYSYTRAYFDQRLMANLGNNYKLYMLCKLGHELSNLSKNVEDLVLARQLEKNTVLKLSP